MNAPISLPSSAPSLVKVVTTLACARGCYYCYNQRLRQNVELDRERLIATLSAMLDAQQSGVDIEVIGGEPLQEPALETSLDVLRIARAHPHGRRLALSTASRSLVTLSKVAPLVDTLYLSVDLFPGKQNRKLVSDARLRAIVRLAERFSMTFSISVVLNGTETAETILDFLHRMDDAGVKEMGFAYEDFAMLDAARARNLVAAFYLLFAQRLLLADRLRIGGSILDILSQYVRGASHAFACACGNACVAIYPDGSVSPSLCLPRNAAEDMSVSFFTAAQAERKSTLEAGACSGCELWNVCLGGCLGAALAASPAPLDAPGRDERQCAILRSVASRLRDDASHAAIRHASI